MRGNRRLRVAQLANYIGPTTGGLRVVVEELGQALLRDGGTRLLVRPGPVPSQASEGADTQLTLRGPRLPGSGKPYHVLLQRRAVRDALLWFAPDIIEVHDQTTLAWVGAWARSRGIPTVLVAHERFDLVVGEVMRIAPRTFASGSRQWSARLARSFDAVVCASKFAGEPFSQVGAANVRHVPLGVDLETFRPPQPGEQVDGPWSPGARRLVFVGRLHVEKAPQDAVEVLARLRAAGVPAELAIAGTGPAGAALRDGVERRGLPVHFLGHLGSRAEVARLVGAAEIALCPGPRETFGLAVLEALACGTPVVVARTGASQELIAPGVGLAGRDADEMAWQVRQLLEDPAALEAMRAAARRHAESYSWARTAAALAELRAELTARSPGRPPAKVRSSS